MRHPFAGIIVRKGEERTEGESPSSRRMALKVMLAGVGCTLASGVTSAQTDDDADADRLPVTGYAAYLVVPHDFRTFRSDRRQKLGVFGDYYRGAADSKNLRGKSGFLAWITAEEAKTVAAANDVAEVASVAAEDKPGPDKRQAATKELRLQVIPGGWKTCPDAATFTATDKLIQQWNKEFAAKEVTFKAGGDNSAVVVDVGVGEPPAGLIARLKEHPQVVAVEWKYPTTERFGEEGGITTQAIGEEGGATTKAVGEEGGPTTLRVGEEGATTMRLGEEGGATTRALGEEGGVTTQAVGEEGGGGKPIKPLK